MKTQIGKICLIGAAAAATGCTAASKDERPNVILILADDLGYSDLGCYGGEIHTPSIDSLASEGLRYLNFYNNARSCPSRASLLTGLCSHSAGIGHMVQDRGLPGYQGRIASNTVTVAQMLKDAGYQTAMAGKWHVTRNISPDGDNADWPLQRGFDEFYGTLSGHGSFWDPKYLMDGNESIRAEGDYYYTEAITENAQRFIKQMDKEKPFFLYVAYTAPHYPLHARQEYIGRYDGLYDKGWDSLRVQRFNRMKSMGILPKHAVLPENDAQCHGWEQEPDKDWQASRMEVFAAMVEQMDKGVGDIMKTLKEEGLSDNTVVIFLSDNGASAEGHLYNTVERLGTPWKDPMIPSYTRDGRKVTAGDVPGMPLGADDTYGSYGPQWAHLSVTPFKRFKSWVHEGGISTPMIITWGNKIKDKGGVRNGVYSILDIMPTFIELSSGTYPEEMNGENTVPLEGISFLPSVYDDVIPERMLFWEHEGNRAVRNGDWKLVSEFPGSWSSMRGYPKNGGWELYNLAEDPTESRDLSSEYPDMVGQLSEQWEIWATGHNVVDWNLLGE